MSIQCPGDPFSVNILIGADTYWDVVNDNIIRGSGPVAVETKLGYVLSGPTQAQSYRSPHIDSILTTICSSMMNTSTYFEIEGLGIEDSGPLDEETFDLNLYLENGIHQESDKSYTAALPLNDNISSLPNNYYTCVHVTREMIRKMPLQKRLAYHKIITEQYDRGFIEYTPHINTTEGHYLMHYGVEKSSSSSTPLRIVYRCNFRIGTNHSLNDCMHSGPPLVQDLGGIIMRMRLFQIVMCSDIEKAFLSVNLRADHRKYTKFLWLSNPHDADSKFVELQFQSVLFGATASPFILNAVLRKHLNQQDCPISSLIGRDVYVDNIISSVPSHAQAEEYYKQANSILANGGFNLRAWSSNDSVVQTQASIQNKACPDTVINVLGMLWDKTQDTLSCKPIPPLDEKTPCPKSALSDTARVFDVPGFLLPVHVRAKRLLQDLQKAKLKWKQPLAQDTRTEWENIHADLVSATTTIKWPRQVIQSLTPETPVQIHVFADSSKHSFGTAAYLVANNQSALLWAKNKLIPVHDSQPRIPRYELNACLMAANLLQYIMRNISSCLNIKKTVLWSDSQIVLHWLHSSKKLEPYVCRRVQKIKQVAFSELRYTPTHANPADLLTRGISTNTLKDSGLWWHGPGWLITGEYPCWDILAFTPTADMTHTTIATIGVHPLPQYADIRGSTVSMKRVCKLVQCERISTLRKLLTVTAMVHHYLSRLLCRTRKRLSERHRKSKPISSDIGPFTSRSDTINEATTCWIQTVQEYHYPHELRQLHHTTTHKTPLVRQLRLFLDNRGIIRKGSRMQHAPIAEETKFRVILPRHSHFTRLVVKDIHIRHCLHDGLMHTLSKVRTAYWISRDTVLTKSILKDCNTCNRLNARPYKAPPSPPLPEWRLNTTQPPFSTTGVDYTGEIWIRDTGTGDLRKVYIVLYTCAVTRAVHLHYVNDLSTGQFLLSFKQFCARKSTPARIVSDNASYFISADNTLKEILSSPVVQDYFATNEIRWKFIPKRAPWFGALYERLIGIMKRNLIKVIGRAILTEYELSTFLVEIECNMNDRPLTSPSADMECANPLTPAHLMYGRQITPLPYSEFDKQDEDYLPPKLTHTTANKMVNRITELQQHYWQRFKTEYFTTLMDIHKLQTKSDFHQAIKVGDVVLVHEDVIKRPLWKLAVITKLLPGEDGLVRAAEIRTANGTTNRPIVKLYPLEITADVSLPCDDKDSQPNTQQPNGPDSSKQLKSRPQRASAIEAKRRIKSCLSVIDEENDNG